MLRGFCRRVSCAARGAARPGLVIVASIVLAWVPPVLSAAATRDPSGVTVGHNLAASVSAFYVALDRGFFAEEGLKLQLVLMQGSAMTQATLSGDIQFGTAFSSGANAAARGAPVKVVIGLMAKPVFTLYVRPDRKIASVRDLRGKKLGVTRIGAGTDSAARAILKHYGLVPDRDVTILTIGVGPSLVAALQTGVIDAASLFPPHSFKAEKLGMVKLAYLGDLFELPASGIFTSEAVIRKQRPLLKQFLRAAVRGMWYFLDERNKADVVRVLTGMLKEDPEVAEASYRFIRAGHTTDGIPSATGLRNYLDLELGSSARAITVEQVFDAGPLREVLAELRASKG